MLTTIRTDLSQLKDDLAALAENVGTKLCLAAADAGGEVILNTYRAELLSRAKTSGTYKSAQGTVEHFIHAYESVAKRTLLFRDREGAYSVVGIATEAGNWRMASPQAMWLEFGADGSSQPESRGGRYRYSDDMGTGIEQAQHILANIVEQTGDVVISTMQRVIAEELEKYVI